jgi:hypothetical protein
MNERIRELAEQAFFDAATSQPSDRMYTFSDHKMQQFAELIVRECAGLCSIAAPGRDAEDIEEAILKHFGVEE